MISAPCMLGVRPALAALLLFCALGAAAPPQDEECQGTSCTFATASQEDGAFGLLQRSMGARTNRTARLVPTMPPRVDVCHSFTDMPIGKADQEFLEGERWIMCDWQTADITCLNWDKVIAWLLPVGHDFSGWPVLLFLAAILLLAGWRCQETGAHTPEEDEEQPLHQVHFWCYDLPPHRSVYLAMAGLLLLQSTLVDHPAYSRLEIPTMRKRAIPWWVIFLPAALCILAMATLNSTSRTKSPWHLASILTTLPATLAFIACEWEFTTAEGHGHRYLILSWTLFGLCVALLALWAAPERRVSSWLRKFAMLVCCVSYINGGISKMLNTRPFGSWLNGEVLRYWTFCVASYNSFKGVPYPWLSRHVVQDIGWSRLLCAANIILELPLSFAALYGLGCFGRVGLIRSLWCIAAFGFHLGVNLLWGANQGSVYNHEAYVNLILVVDVLGHCAFWRAGPAQEPAQEAKALLRAAAASKASQLTLQLLSLTCSFALFSWLTVGLLGHFNDPKWPITSVPMFSMTCGILGCDESFQNTVYHLPWLLAVTLSMAGTSMVFLRPPAAIKS